MDICRLCLQNMDLVNILNVEENLNILQKFLPQMNRAIRKTPIICEVCIENVNAAGKLMKHKNSSEIKIKEEINRLKVKKLDLRYLHRTEMNVENLNVCRLCLGLIRMAQIYLCENFTNVLPHDYIRSMLKFCNIRMDFELSYKPVMCTDCWQLLQVTYTFKKSYLEVERQIRVFCQDFRFRTRNLDKEALKKLKHYFSEDYCKITSDIKRMNSKDEAAHIRKACSPQTTKSIKIDNKTYLKREHSLTGVVPRRRRAKIKRFMKNDNLLLMRAFFEVTTNGEFFKPGYLNKIEKRWSELNPVKQCSLKKLSLQIERIYQEKLLTKAELDSVKTDLKERSRIEKQAEPLLEIYSDSDDSFTEEAIPSSFTPCIKSEPLSNSDVEFSAIEPKLEPLSDSESLPQLERMELPPLTIKIENIYSLNFNRETTDYVGQDVDESPDNLSRRSLRDRRDSELYKCPECKFETKYKRSADRHATMHRIKKNSIHQCSHCPYKISNKWLFNRHMKNHTDKDEIPTLFPELQPIEFVNM